MILENEEFSLKQDTVRTAVGRSLESEPWVQWFLFLSDDESEILGLCHMQAVHNYWRAGHRYYLGGYFIRPEYRGKGVFRQSMEALKQWASERNGVQIFVHIHDENEKSSGAFSHLGFRKDENSLYCWQWIAD